MKRPIIYIFALMAAAMLAACGAPGGSMPANNASSNSNAAKPMASAPTRDALVTLEKSAYEAWKTKDSKFWDTFLSDKFVGYGSFGRLEKATATKEYTGVDCDIKSYSLSDEQMTPLGNDVALLTYKTTVDGTCGGQKVPANSWAAGVYVREGDAWKGAFHAESPIVDPKGTTAHPPDTKDAAKMDEAKKEKSNFETRLTTKDGKPLNEDGTPFRDEELIPTAPEAILAAEKAVWEAWKDHDQKRIEEITAKDISFINIFGTYFANKADAVKDWTSPGCNVTSVSVTNGSATMLSPEVGILRFNGAADGTCFGQKVGPIWGTSVYVKEGDTWKWAFGINLPAH